MWQGCPTPSASLSLQEGAAPPGSMRSWPPSEPPARGGARRNLVAAGGEPPLAQLSHPLRARRSPLDPFLRNILPCFFKRIRNYLHKEKPPPDFIKKYSPRPIRTSAVPFLSQTIQLPGLGSDFITPENVPIIMRMVVIPIEKKNSINPPSIAFFVVDVYISRPASTGDVHGAATNPESIPVMNAPMYPPLSVVLTEEKTGISTQSIIQKARIRHRLPNMR